MKTTTSSLLFASLISISSVEAFDNNREGFIIGVGAGVSRSYTDVTTSKKSDFNIKSEYSTGLATSLKIGYGFTKQFSLYYLRNVSWFGFDGDKKDDTYINGITGLGASYYVDECGPWYVTGGFGLGDFGNFSEKEYEKGSAVMLGIGYEFAPHIQIESNYIRSTIKDNGTELDTGAFQITVNYLWY